MRNLFIPALMIFVNMFTVSGQHADTSQVIPGVREQWLERTRQEMVNFHSDTCRKTIEPEITDLGEEYYSCSYRLQGPGMIRISAEEWIYLVASSAHDNPEVGDITLGMDQKKRFYINEGHVCGGIIHFQSLERIELKTSKQFFKHFVSDTDSAGWVRY